MNLASCVRGLGEGVAYLIGAPGRQSGRVPVTVGLPVAGTRSCAYQDMKSIKITGNIRVDECISREKEAQIRSCRLNGMKFGADSAEPEIS